MPNAPSTNQSDTSLTRDILYAVRYYLGGRRTLFFLAALLIVGGVALNWGWLAAIGVAPILLALLPCAVMCALGLCMHKMTSRAQGTNKNAIGTQAQRVQTSNSQAQIVEAPVLVDPVSRRPLPCATVVASAHKGHVYYFENRANRDVFEADPEKYLAETEVMAAAASSIAPVAGVADASA